MSKNPAGPGWTCQNARKGGCVLYSKELVWIRSLGGSPTDARKVRDASLHEDAPSQQLLLQTIKE